MVLANKNKQSGFTFIELLVVIAIVAIIATFAVESFVEYRDTQSARAVSVDISSIFNETRQKTLSSESVSAQFGVYFSTSTVTVFEGSTYNPAASGNVVHSFVNTNIDTQLSDGSSQIIFARLTGTPSATGTIEIGHSKLNSTTTITIIGSGLLE